MAFNWVNLSDNVNNNIGTSLNVGATNARNANGTFTSGDLLLGVLIVSTTTNTVDPGSHSWPAGWTRPVDDWNTNPGSVFGDINYHYSWAWKIAGGSETGSYPVSWTNAARGASWVLFDYTGANASPIDASGNRDATAAGTNQMVAPALTTTNTADLELIIGLYAGSLGPYTTPAGFTSRAAMGSTSSTRPEFIAYDRTLSALNPGAVTITTSVSGVPSAISIAIAPGGGSPTDDRAFQPGAIAAAVLSFRERASGLLEPVRELWKPRRPAWIR